MGDTENKENDLEQETVDSCLFFESGNRSQIDLLCRQSVEAGIKKNIQL